MSAEELYELSYMPHAELRLAVPVMVIVPDALGSRAYTHEPPETVKPTAKVDTGTLCHPSTRMK